MNPVLAQLTFTADDWGMSPGINSAILDMAQKGVIKRVSILAGSPFVKHGLDELLQVKGLQFGLHFNLTMFPPLFEEQQDAFSPFMDPASFHYKPLWKLRLLWANPFLRKTCIAAATDAFKGQLEKLRTLKVPVSYFDGHQNVHLLPGLLEAVAPEVKKWGIRETLIASSLRFARKRQFRLALLALRAKRTATRVGLIYQPVWRPGLNTLRSLKRVVKKASGARQSLSILVHPSAANDLENYGIRDRYRIGRVREYQALCKLLKSVSSS